MAIVIASSVYLYAGVFFFAVIVAIVLKMYYHNSSKKKFREYQSEIARSHSKILKLEVQNEKLQQRINELEATGNKMRIA